MAACPGAATGEPSREKPGVRDRSRRERRFFSGIGHRHTISDGSTLALSSAQTIYAEARMTVKQMESAQAQQKEQERQRTQSEPHEGGGPQQPGESPQDNQSRQHTQSGDERGMARRTTTLPVSPFSMLQRFFFGNIADLFGESLADGAGSQQGATAADLLAWTPKVDVVQRGGELIVRADLPGMKPEDVVVEVSEDAITISGERRQEKEDDRGGVYRFERSYGAFLRVIPLPEGAITDQAKASFKDGVLEIAVPAPPEQVSRGRRLEIGQGEQTKDNAATNGKAGKTQ
jgi:HSP20 family protein